jgi:hypothetical protein
LPRRRSRTALCLNGSGSEPETLSVITPSAGTGARPVSASKQLAPTLAYQKGKREKQKKRNQRQSGTHSVLECRLCTDRYFDFLSWSIWGRGGGCCDSGVTNHYERLGFCEGKWNRQACLDSQFLHATVGHREWNANILMSNCSFSVALQVQRSVVVFGTDSFARVIFLLASPYGFATCGIGMHHRRRGLLFPDLHLTHGLSVLTGKCVTPSSHCTLCERPVDM